MHRALKTIDTSGHFLRSTYTVFTKDVYIQKDKCVLEQFGVLDVKHPVRNETRCQGSNNAGALHDSCLIGGHSKFDTGVKHVFAGAGDVRVQRAARTRRHKRLVAQAERQKHCCQGDVMICKICTRVNTELL